MIRKFFYTKKVQQIKKGKLHFGIDFKIKVQNFQIFRCVFGLGKAYLWHIYFNGFQAYLITYAKNMLQNAKKKSLIYSIQLQAAFCTDLKSKIMYAVDRN